MPIQNHWRLGVSGFGVFEFFSFLRLVGVSILTIKPQI